MVRSIPFQLADLNYFSLAPYRKIQSATHSCSWHDIFSILPSSSHHHYPVLLRPYLKPRSINSCPIIWFHYFLALTYLEYHYMRNLSKTLLCPAHPSSHRKKKKKVFNSPPLTDKMKSRHCVPFRVVQTSSLCISSNVSRHLYMNPSLKTHWVPTFI